MRRSRRVHATLASDPAGALPNVMLFLIILSCTGLGVVAIWSKCGTVPLRDSFAHRSEIASAVTEMGERRSPTSTPLGGNSWS